MTRPQIDGDELEMLKELEDAEDVGSHKQMVETLIREAYDEYDTGSYVYDPRMERITPLSTDEMREICWRYDAPAINPGHIMKWPRDRSDKREVLAAICRYEGIDSSGGVKSVIREQLTEGDPITVREVEGEHNKDVRAPRNIHNYHDYILGELEEYPPEEADNLPDDFHEEAGPIEGLPAEQTAEEWLSTMRKHIDDGTAAEALEQFADNAEDLIEQNADHPDVYLIEQGRDELKEEIERRQGSEGDGDADNEEEIAEEEVGEEMEKFAEAEEADDENGDENYPDDRPETEKKREAIKRKGGDPTAKK